MKIDALMPFYGNKTALFMGMLSLSVSVQADWNTQLKSSTYFTDDVALFSVTRRLSLKDDPTQPAVDLPKQGADFVYEPSAELTWRGNNALGDIAVSLDAGAYVFTDKTDYTHGLYELQLTQTFVTHTKLRVDYNFIPELFLGRNVLRQAGLEESEHDEQLTNHFWSLHLDQPLSDTLTVRLLGRYGLRRYNAPFEHRNTEFWTLGPHIEWEINPVIALLVGYHYERGVADHQKTINAEDDISYINHYASAELTVHVSEKLTGAFIFDYENNEFISQYLNDEHWGAAENLFQGEIELLYALNKATTVKLGWQHGNRKLSTETQIIKNNNLWLGLEYAF